MDEVAGDGDSVELAGVVVARIGILVDGRMGTWRSCHRGTKSKMYTAINQRMTSDVVMRIDTTLFFRSKNYPLENL